MRGKILAQEVNFHQIQWGQDITWEKLSLLARASELHNSTLNPSCKILRAVFHGAPPKELSFSCKEGLILL